MLQPARTPLLYRIFYHALNYILQKIKCAWNPKDLRNYCNYKWVNSLVLILFIAVRVNGQELKPFPQHYLYTAGTIRPSHLPQQQLDKQVSDFYDQWKARYVKTGCNKNQHYIWFEKPG